MRRSWGWAGTVAEFLELPDDAWRSALKEHFVGLCNEQPSGSQRAAWDEEGAIMRFSFEKACAEEPSARSWSVAFEYELPLEGGRRPDVVVLAGKAVVVLEFKQDSSPQPAAIDQVSAYARDLAEYHEASHGRTVTPVLVLTRASGSSDRGGVVAIEPDSLGQLLLDEHEEGDHDLGAWLDSPYAPLPTLVAAARLIFQNEPLPSVKRAESSGIPAAVDLLGRLTEDAAARGERVLAFVAGVPGAGKTLAGLSLVYERAQHCAANFLSGNGPLVEVLQDALQSRSFVNDMHGFIKTYGLTDKVAKEHVVVFDEAQRAWDRDYMQFQHGFGHSEPELLVRAGERIPGWAALVGLVGDGQEIHAGEEAGIGQWRDAITGPLAKEQWQIHCPPRLAHAFAGLNVTAHPELDLTISLRSRRAEHLHDWVAALIGGDLPAAAHYAAEVRAAGFPLYLTRDLDAAKAYARDRYAGDPNARYGVLVSERARSYLERHGVNCSYPAVRKVKLARWFNEPAGHSQSCCALTDVVTEFRCQGLELDLPILCWGNDFSWDGARWVSRFARTKYELNDYEQIRRNAYRVLLTRGRDGVVVVVPRDPALDRTSRALIEAGMQPLRPVPPSPGRANP